MKKFFLLLITLAAFVSCKKSKVEKSVCSSPPLMMELDTSYLAMPSLITPNEDGINDELKLISKGILQATVSILNSKGEFVGVIKTIGGTWDGVNTGGKWANEVHDGEYECTVTATSVAGTEKTQIAMLSVLKDPSKYCPNNKDACSTESQWSNTFEIFNKQTPSGETFSCE